MSSIKSIAILSLLFIVTSTIVGCSSNPKNISDEDLAKEQVETLYKKGKSALDKGNYTFALDYYKALESNYPYGSYTEQAKLDMIFAYDKSNQSELALAAADNFIKLYPTHQNIDYAYFMKGVANFDKKLSSLDKYIKGNNRAVRDPQSLRDSASAFEELIKRYPNSIYASDSKKRIIYIHNSLSARELNVAQYYYETETYVAAVNRCKNIIYKYENTPSVEGALVLMEKAYVKMGMTDLAASTHTVLFENFPNNKSKTASKKKKGFFKRLISRD